MTRGVLLQSDNPEKTLKEFGIHGSYAILADVSLYDHYPIAREDNLLLSNEFVNQYDGADISLYYLRHPSSLFAMLELGVRASFDMGRDYCGNYEEIMGMPARAKSPFWSAYSIYKSRSAPKTMGYLLLLVIAFVLMSGRKMFRGKELPDRFHYVYMCGMSLTTFIGVADIFYVIIRSGDTQLTQYNFLLGQSMDILFFYVFTEILYKLNILEAKREEMAAQ